MKLIFEDMGKANMDSADIRKTKMESYQKSCGSSLKLRWRQLRVSSEDRRTLLYGVLKPSRKICRRRDRNSSPTTTEPPTGSTRSTADDGKKTPRHHGTMAPRNTTQYLMSVVSVSAALDSHSGFMDYQQRDFEEAFGLV